MGKGVEEGGGTFVDPPAGRGEDVAEVEEEGESEDDLEVEGGEDLWGGSRGGGDGAGEESEEEEEEEEEEEDKYDDAVDFDAIEVPAPSAPQPTAPPGPASVLLTHFGHTSFRPGQAWAINRVLGKQRSLLVAATGGGKSLCYSLPSALMTGLTIVVSPLLSLMADQMGRLPPRVAGACLSGNASKSESAVVVSDACEGRVKVLFVSPERLCSAAFRRLLRPRRQEDGGWRRPLPKVSLLCVDEAHCLSQWSHNFRASYMRLRGMLDLVKPESVLALTATAGPQVIDDICSTLGIPPGRAPDFADSSLSESDNTRRGEVGDGVRVLSAERHNIDPAVLVLESEEDRRAVLYKMLKKPPKGREGSERDKALRAASFEPGCLAEGSVIVYVWTKRQAEALVDLLRGAGVEGGVVYYHGGMGQSERFSSQTRFMRGRARVVVATVAFGLGIDKGDVRGVVHCCLPKSFEHYVQEIGRAGRDGRPSVARAMVLKQDVVEQVSLSHTGGVTACQVKEFLRITSEAARDVIGDVPEPVRSTMVFSELSMSVPVLKSVNRCDLRAETVETLLSLMEEEEFGSLLELEGGLADVCVVILKKRKLEELAKTEAVASCILRVGTLVSGSDANARLEEEGGTAMEKGFHAYALGNYSFSIVRVANAMGSGCEPRNVYAALRRLEGRGELETLLDTGVRGKGFGVKLNKKGVEMLRSGETEEVAGKLVERMNAKEESAEKKVRKRASIGDLQSSIL